MFHSNLSGKKQCARRPPTLSYATAVVVSGALAIVTYLEQPAAAFGENPPQSRSQTHRATNKRRRPKRRSRAQTAGRSRDGDQRVCRSRRLFATRS